MLTLVLSFFAVALLYSTVGFGGGSSYIALFAVAGVSYTLIPKLSLLCNLLVVTGGCYHYYRKGHFNKKLLLPFILSSAPMAFLGGVYPIKEKTFFILLIGTLLLCGLRILFISVKDESEIRPPSFPLALFTGGTLGLLSGMVGIGGGIFLSPIIIYMGWARSKDAAAVASAFIFLNSLAGLIGQFTKEAALPEFQEYLPLFVAVILGGQIGSRLGTHSKTSYGWIQKGTGVLTLFIGIRLLLKVFA